MESWLVSVLCVGLMIVLAFSGVYIAYALFLSGMLGILLIGGAQMLGAQLGLVSYSATASYGYVVIPLYILMGQLASEAGLGQDAFHTARLWIGHLRGGLLMATTVACGLFGGISGSSAADAAVFSRVAFPEMVRFGYDRSLAAGCIAAAGTLAIMIPPSILLVLYGIIAEQPIGKLLIGGIGAGLLEVVLYVLVVSIVTGVNPKLAPTVKESVSWRERLVGIRSIVPIAIIFVFAIGGILFGIFTPTEGAAMGAGASLMIAMAMRRMTWKAFTLSLKESSTISGMIFLAIIGGLLFSRMLVLGGIVESVSAFIIALPVSRHIIFMGIVVLYIILGMIMQPIVIMLITIPVLLPTMVAMGYDPVWFGIMFVALSEMAVITPPVAVNLYTVKGVLGDQVSTDEIFRGTLWFLVADVATLFLLYVFPQIALWLPGVVYK